MSLRDSKGQTNELLGIDGPEAIANFCNDFIYIRVEKLHTIVHLRATLIGGRSLLRGVVVRRV